MNERIRQLARQSTGASTIYMLEEEWEKFAELIIQECATLVDAEEIQSSYGDMIKQHFGVGHE